MTESDLLFIWISRWEDFQHYKPERDRGPAWIKDYTKQLLDDRYLRLTDRQRALLRDLRDVFAMTQGRLTRDAHVIARHRQSQTRHVDLEALNHAGFIEFISRETLELRLERFYSYPRARVEGEVEVERETPLPPSGETPRTRAEAEPAQPKLLDVAVPLEVEETPEERRRIAEQIRQQFSKIGRPMNGKAGETETESETAPHPGPTLQVAETWEPVEPAADEGRSSDWVSDEPGKGA